jgi:hypothetical protein
VIATAEKTSPPVMIKLGGSRNTCLMRHCRKPAQFTVEREGHPDTHHCGHDLVLRVESFKRQGHEIVCSVEARLALDVLGFAEEVFS